MKKKILFALTIAIASAFLFMSASAATASSRVSLDDVNEVSFSYEGMSTEKAEQILRAMFEGSEEYDDYYISERGLICAIFGHNLNFGVITTIWHRQYPTAPRCREERAFIEYCTRCSHFRVTSETTGRTFCCP